MRMGLLHKVAFSTGSINRGVRTFREGGSVSSGPSSVTRSTYGNAGRRNTSNNVEKKFDAKKVFNTIRTGAGLGTAGAGAYYANSW